MYICTRLALYEKIESMYICTRLALYEKIGSMYTCTRLALYEKIGSVRIVFPSTSANTLACPSQVILKKILKQ